MNTPERKTVEGEMADPPDEIERFITSPDNHDDAAPQAEADLKSYGLCKRLRVDKVYRRRFIHSFWLFWAFVGMGWGCGQIGPSFPDLRLIVNQELDVASWLFSASSVGYFLGSLLGGYLYDHINKFLLLFFSILIMAVGTIVLPWCSSFPLMIAIRIVSRIGLGCLDTDHFLTASSSMNSSAATNTTGIFPCTEEFGETHVHYAFLISGVLSLSCALPFLIMFLYTVRIEKKSHEMNSDKGNKRRPEQLPLLLKVVLLVFLVLFVATYNAVEDNFCAFLMTFALQHLKWTKAQGSYATSLHWFSFSVGRFLGILLSKNTKPVKMLFGYCVILICSLIGFLVASVTMTTDLVLVFIALTGVSMSIISPCLFTGTEESILEVTGMISAIFKMASSTGLLINPIFLGFLMDNYDPIIFAYFLFAESCACFLLFLVTVYLVKKFVGNYRPSSSDI